MSLLLLDDQLDVHQVLFPIRKWAKARLLHQVRPGEHVLDERVPAILRTLKQPTFITIDVHFWDRRLRHPDYAILYFVLRDDEQDQLPGLLRTLFRRVEFRTRSRRMGKVSRVSHTHIDWWQFQTGAMQRVAWQPASRPE